MADLRVRLGDHIAGVVASPLARFADRTPWALVADARAIVRALLETLSAEDYVSELKASFLFAGGKLAHFNFVGESVLWWATGAGSGRTR